MWLILSQEGNPVTLKGKCQITKTQLAQRCPPVRTHSPTAGGSHALTAANIIQEKPPAYQPSYHSQSILTSSDYTFRENRKNLIKRQTRNNFNKNILLNLPV